MSTYWSIKCELCEEPGPQIGRTASGMTFVDPLLNEPVGGTALARFLIAHEYHELVLEHE